MRAIDNAGNTDGSPASFEWTVDTATPAAPELTASVPASPANDNTPEIVGSAPSGTTVRLYSGADCSGTPLATVAAAGLEAGVEVTVPDNSSTDFRATATSSAENTSACSEPLTYIEDSSAPTTQIDSSPPALTNSAAASFEFSGADAGGSGVASFQCRLDSSEAGRLGGLHFAPGLLRTERRRPQIRGPRHRPSRQHRPEPGLIQLERRHHRAHHPIDSSPPALTNSAAASFTFSGTDPGGSGVASFQCRIDSEEPGRLGRLHFAPGLLRTRRRRPQIRGAGDR